MLDKLMLLAGWRILGWIVRCLVLWLCPYVSLQAAKEVVNDVARYGSIALAAVLLGILLLGVKRLVHDSKAVGVGDLIRYQAASQGNRDV